VNWNKQRHLGHVKLGRWWLFLSFVLAFARSESAAYVNFEGKQTSPLRLSADGTRLFAVNTPDARLSVFDVTQPSNPRLIAEIPVGVEPASVNPRTTDEVWVVNEVSDSISIVSVSQRMVTDTLYVPDEPADVVFAGGMAFVSAARKNVIAVFDVTSHNLVTNIAVFGENPRALAVDTNGTKVYAAFALSGNHTTIITATNAPPQQTNGTPPMNPNLPPPPQVGLIVDATNSTYYPSLIKYTMPDNDVVEIDVASLAITRYFPHVGTVNLGLAIQPGSGNLYVANTDARNLVHFEPTVRAHAVDNRITLIDINTGAVTPYDINPGVNYSVLPNLPALTNALAQPTAIVFDPSGSFFYVAAFGSDRVAKIDANNPTNVLARIELCPTAHGSAADPRNKRGPRGLALNASAQRLYVLNRIANTLCILDTSANTVLKEFPVGSYDPTPSVIRNGRGFLYDAKLSGNGTMACAACHVDAEMDLIAWDLGDPTGQLATNKSVATIPIPPFFVTNNSVFHPMKGPMTTQTLRGLNTLDPFHWRGDRTNFSHFNIAFPGLMGSASLSTADMSAYSNFINTITYEPNPNQNLDRTYPTNFPGGGDANAGHNAFLFTNYTAGLACTTCHTAPPGPGSDRVIIAAAALQESQDFKVPQLRAIYQKTHFNNIAGTNSIGGFGFTHDGTDPTLQVFLSRQVFVNIRNDTTIKNNLAAFVQSFDTGTAPAVGYSRTLTSNNVSTSAITNDWTLLENQALLTNIDLVVKGTVNGSRHGFWYQPTSGLYTSDSTKLGTLTHGQLFTNVQNGDTITLMGVPVGSGYRMGIDRNEDGILDGDVPPPQLQIALASGQKVLNWPYSAAGFGLEESASLSPGSWSNVPDPWEIINQSNYVTNSSSSAGAFFRLRFQ
jgi:DNA-binding beta-propeller fold protein YncE